MDVSCNRCNKVFDQGICILCPYCRCPEFSHLPGCQCDWCLPKKKETEMMRAKGKAADQPYLPDMEPKKHVKIHRAAVAYAKVRDERIEKLQEEIKARDKLVDLMNEAGMPVYEYLDVKAELRSKTTEKVKVVIRSENPDEGRETNGNGHPRAKGGDQEGDE